MKTLDKKFRPFMAAVSIFAIVAIAILATVLAMPADISAQDGSDAPPAAPPPPPPPLNPPIQTPEPGQVVAKPHSAGVDLGVDVVRFRPKERIRFGEVSIPAEPVNKDVQKLEAPQLVSPPGAYAPPAYDKVLAAQGWNLEFSDSFEGAFPDTWLRYDTYPEDGLEYFWGDINFYTARHGDWSVWPAYEGANGVDPTVTGGYPNNVASWLITEEYDFSDLRPGIDDIFVGFGLWYNTEPEYDWIKFCVSTQWPDFYCDYWSGYSGDYWMDIPYWLGSYAGYSEVRFAWLFTSDGSVGGDYGYLGPLVDTVQIWTYTDEGAATPTPDPNGQLIQNGSFEEASDHLMHWGTDSVVYKETASDLPKLDPSSRPQAEFEVAPGDGPSSIPRISTVAVTNTTSVEGDWSTYLWYAYGAGDDFLYQTIDIPADVTDVILNFWFAVTTYETNVDTDYFCLSLADPADRSIIWDLGCMDATDTTGYWQEVLYALDASEVALIAGQSVALVFELYNRGDIWTGTAGWVDYARVYAVGGSGVAESVDPNEPNDDAASATTLTCGDPISGTIGDALGGYDADWFVVNSVPTGQMDIDIDAATKIPRSDLDSVVSLWSGPAGSPTLLAWNDDDGASYDSYLTYTVASAADYYVKVESYSGDGSPDYFYDLTVQCAGAGGGPPAGSNEITDVASGTWTIMLYLNAEDPNFEATLIDYIEGMETLLAGKTDFLSVTVLYDGPTGSSNAEFGAGTTRLLVQPNGVYVNSVNRWDVGEQNMGDPSTLAGFVNWSMDQYPADHYYLAVDDHGDGVYGISFDSASNNDQLEPPELYSALKDATRQGARKIDIFDYEACLMGLTENAYDLRNWVDYVVFFEQISWGLNTYPRYFNDLAQGDSPLTVGQRIIDRYHAEANATGYPHTISLIDTGQMEAVRNAVSDFGNALSGNAAAINNVRDTAQAFAADYDATNPLRAEYIDLWDLAARAGGLASTQAAAVQSAVDAAVVAEEHASGGVSGYIWDHSGAHGLSIYYPTTQSSSAFSDYTTGSLYRMSQDGTWDDFLASVVATGNRRGMSSARSEIKLTGDQGNFIFTYVYLPLVMK